MAGPTGPVDGGSGHYGYGDYGTGGTTDLGGDTPDAYPVGSGSSSYVPPDGEGGGPTIKTQDYVNQLQDQYNSIKSDPSIPYADKNKLLKELSGLITKVKALPDGAPIPANLQTQLDAFQASAAGATPSDSGDGQQGDGGNVSSADITTLLNAVQNGTVKPKDGSNLSQSDLVNLLNKAMNDEIAGKTADAASEYAQALDAVGGQDALDPKNIAGQKLGAAPTSIDSDGTFHFDGKADGGTSELSLNAPGDGSKVVVDNATTVTLTPKNKDDAVTVSLDGNYYVIQMGNDTFKINKDAHINILSDNVTGTVDSKDDHITIGAAGSTTTLANQNAMTDLGNKLAGASAKIGFVTYTDGSQQSNPDTFSGGLGGNSGTFNTFGGNIFNMTANTQGFTYGVGYYGDYTIQGPGSQAEAESEAKKAKDVISAMADATQEKDPAKQQDKWSHALDVLSRVMSEDSETGHVNNVGQLIFDTLYGELGEDGLKNALQQGLIPANFANKLADLLTAKPDENTTKGGEIDGYQVGGPGWTHQTSADFLKNNVGGGASSEGG